VSARRAIGWLCAGALIAGVLPVSAQDAGKILRSVRGTVGYQTAQGAPFRPLFGRIELPDDDLAITRAASNAALQLPDSSEVALGANTTVQVGAFNSATSPTPTTIAIQNGAVRFAVRHPAGGVSNYRFTTTTSQVAVRGTIALVQTSPGNGDTIACLDCAPGDVTVTITATGQQITLLTGQTLTVSASGGGAVSATTDVVLAGFAATGLSTTAVSPTAFAPGVEEHIVTGGSGVSIGGIAAAAAAAAAIGITAGNNGNPGTPAGNNSPVVGHTPTPTPTPTVAPTLPPGPTPTATAPINVITNGHGRTPPAPPPGRH
jgi:hypothetical protein